MHIAIYTESCIIIVDTRNRVNIKQKDGKHYAKHFH